MAPDRPGKDSPLRRDIERQPSVLAALQLRQAEFITAGHTWLRPDAGGRLFVAGCGDGYFAAAAAQNFAERLHLAWQVTGPLDLLLGSARLTPADRLLVISMSGNVDRTVESALAAKAAGTPVLALVNSPRGGRLGEIANACISLQLEDLAPFLCGTSSYTATLLALLALAVGAADGLAVPSLDTILDAQRLALAQTDGVLHKLGLPSGVRLLSAGADRATVAYGAAKLVELTQIPAWSGDLEEFAHSQY
ncbi:MAG: SIS domain-containing protein, partial [Rhodoferax sp.]|nr:SIS domain-containing protein [Rhodoferax sp.]